MSVNESMASARMMRLPDLTATTILMINRKAFPYRPSRVALRAGCLLDVVFILFATLVFYTKGLLLPFSLGLVEC